MHQTLYSKPVDGFPVPPPPLGQSTVYTHPTDRKAFAFLQVDKYLSEFKTEVDKARVRANLGIPDEYSYNWGHINGSIENQRDLMTILNSITRKQNNLESQLTGINSIVNNLVGTDENSKITTEELYRQFLDLKINVAQNSTDISNLVTGGDTSINNQVNQNKNNINSLLSRVTTLESKTDNDTVYDDSELRQQIANLNASINLLQQQIGGNVTTGITASRTSINATPNSSNIPITIIASYTKLRDEDVTNLCTVQVEDETVVTWENGEIVVNPELEETKATNVNFTYDGFTATVSVNVEVAAPAPTYKYYIGWAPSYSQILKNVNFETSTIDKTWTDANLQVYENTYPTYLWACVPSNIIITNINYGGISEVPEIGEVSQGYNIYYLGYAENSIAGTSLTIEIQQNGQ